MGSAWAVKDLELKSKLNGYFKVVFVPNQFSRLETKSAGFHRFFPSYWLSNSRLPCQRARKLGREARWLAQRIVRFGPYYARELRRLIPLGPKPKTSSGQANGIPSQRDSLAETSIISANCAEPNGSMLRSFPFARLVYATERCLGG